MHTHCRHGRQSTIGCCPLGDSTKVDTLAAQGDEGQLRIELRGPVGAFRSIGHRGPEAVDGAECPVVTHSLKIAQDTGVEATVRGAVASECDPNEVAEKWRYSYRLSTVGIQQ